VALLATFVVVELRLRHPLIRLGIFRMRSITGANAAMLLVAAGMFSLFYFASIYVQEVLGYSALRAGLAFLPVTAGIVIGAGLSQQLIPRVGVRAVGLVGMSIAAAGLILLSRIPVAGTYLGDLLPGLMVMAVGMGLTFVPITLIATTNVEEDDAGLASGLLNTSQQLGGAIGLAVLSTLAANTTSGALAALGHAPNALAQVTALVSGFHVAFLVGAFLNVRRRGHHGGDGATPRREQDRPHCGRAGARRMSGFTPQYAQLEELQQRYSGRGFTVIGFPCNQFGAQEPGKAADIAWNFEKFVVSPRGDVVARFRSNVAPDAPQVVAAIEAQLPPE